MEVREWKGGLKRQAESFGDEEVFNNLGKGRRERMVMSEWLVKGVQRCFEMIKSFINASWLYSYLILWEEQGVGIIIESE